MVKVQGQVCSKCSAPLTNNSYRDCTTSSGYSSWCIDCSDFYSLERGRTIEGVIKTIYDSQVSNSKGRGHEAPNYSKQDLLNYCLSSSRFIELYNAWVESEYLKDLKPSIDRLEDNKGYSFGNIRVTTWLCNKLKGEHQRMKPIAQYTKQNKLVKKFNGLNEAIRETGFGGIKDVVTGRRKTAGGFKWKYLQ